MRVRNLERWKHVNWVLTNEEIAAALSVTIWTVYVRRREYAPGTGRPTGPPRKKEWLAVDWRASNRVIAKKMGVTTSTVVFHRKTYAPATVRSYAPRTKHARDEGPQGHDDGSDGHNFACKVCGAWVSPDGCARVLFPQPNYEARDRSGSGTSPIPNKIKS